ncbi:hypothetical protein INR75_06785 [Zunongwangia sp. SCSIO 43204]|uniref:hypothetical protein n=1 Tax=Zunongwangia sp. SCSIO 43204 TaxID=2779359 RepID=UPI001CA8967B|nr:hypothetical protein [Zunongwangia sp. SCSIO 43204]UAB85713.1 hypothetical protein INR75_06785 [Zunongwangia sp. SCSIO 43204]
MKVVNLQGKIQTDYSVKAVQVEGKEFAIVKLYMRLPNTDKYFLLENIIAIKFDTFKDNLRAGLLKAEESWGLELLKLDISESA